LPAKRVRQSRGRDNRAALKFRSGIFAVREGWVTTMQVQWRQQGQQGQKLPRNAGAKLWGAHASTRAGERVSRSRTSPLRWTRHSQSHLNESLFRRDAETRHARRVRSPELVGGNGAYA